MDDSGSGGGGGGGGGDGGPSPALPRRCSFTPRRREKKREESRAGIISSGDAGANDGYARALVSPNR